MFRKKEDDSFITLNPLEREVLRKVIRDPGFELIGVLPFDDAEKYGFAAAAPSPPGVAPSLWNAAFDPSSRKTYFFNVETKQTVWTLPAGGRVVARVIPRMAEIVFRMKSIKEAMAVRAIRELETFPFPPSYPHPYQQLIHTPLTPLLPHTFLLLLISHQS